MPMGLPHRIAIVGAGLIGSALAGHLILAGNKVTIGFAPIRVGTLANSAPIDPGGVLFPGLLGLFSPHGMRTTLDKGPFTSELPCRT